MVCFQTYQNTSNAILADTLCKKLNHRGYQAQFCADENAAVESVLGLIPEQASVGIPGTVTIRQLGLMEKLSERGNKIFQHWDPSLKPEEKKQRFLDANSADWFLTSSNAITLSGDLVNIDGVGNRVSAMAWAPGKILYVIGMNKICPDLQSAIERVRNVATPPNCVRLNGQTPCAKLGHCANCDVPDRVCRMLAIMERPPFGRESHILLVGANLGY